MNDLVCIDYNEVLDSLEKSLEKTDNICLYIDFPFCRSNCLYCIYHSLPYKSLLEHREEYVNAVLKQLESYEHLLKLKPIQSVYFGGGTPSLWTEQELLEIVHRIPNFEKIDSVKSEMHPFDITDQRIGFYAKILNLKVASLGVQSLNPESCKGQHRLYVSPDKLKHIVEEFHKYGIYVNIDLVALFNGDTEEDWRIFDHDLHTVVESIKPDVITSIPNYRTKLDYLSQIPRFRKILSSVCSGVYIPSSSKTLSMDNDDIRRYGKNDHWIGTKEFFEFSRNTFRYCCSSPKNGRSNNQMTIAIGGADKHLVYSYTYDGKVFYSSYDFEQKEFRYYSLK